MKTNQSGRSMIEMLGVLAIIGVLSVGGIAGYSKAMSKYRTNKSIDQVSMLITNVRTMYAQQQNYTNLNNVLAIDMGVVPEEMIVAGLNNDSPNKLRNIFSGQVFVSESTIDTDDSGEVDTTSADKNAFVITFYGLSRDACVSMATSDWGAGSSSGLVGLHVFDYRGAASSTTDTVIQSVGKFTDGSLTSAENSADEGAVAIPGDTTYKVPLTVDQARAACACPTKTTCAISWKYF